LTPTEAALKKLQKENERLRIENEILKKAAAYFAKHPKGK
jgi:transposase-like protein